MTLVVPILIGVFLVSIVIMGVSSLGMHSKIESQKIAISNYKAMVDARDENIANLNKDLAFHQKASKDAINRLKKQLTEAEEELLTFKKKQWSQS